jgi:hypothetical protein
MERNVPCEALEMTTFALGTADPDGSFTTPEIPAEPPTDCANAHADSKSEIAVVAFQFMRDSSLSSFLKPRILAAVDSEQTNIRNAAG